MAIALCCGVAAAFAEVAGCGLNAGGAATASADASLDQTAPVDAAPIDALVDQATDAGSDQAADAPPEAEATDCGALLSCNGACVSSCAACDGGIVLCTATRSCASDCTVCAPFGLGVTCYSCSGAPSGFCAGNVSACPNDTNAGACPCASSDAGDCPGATQICTGGGSPLCKTCGQGGTDKKQCGDGLFCTASTGACDRDQ
jgi:hypothetical protein